MYITAYLGVDTSILGVFKLGEHPCTPAKEGVDYKMCPEGIALKEGFFFMGFPYFDGVKIKKIYVKDNKRVQREENEWTFGGIRRINFYEKNYPILFEYYKKIVGKKNFERTMTAIKELEDFL
jgi:hypothetical protein